MPEIFTRTLASSSAIPWNFTQWEPQVVVINLGTNDKLNDDEPSVSAHYQRAYVDLILNISAWYRHTQPSFFLACGPISEAYCSYVMNTIEIVSLRYGIPAYFLDQRGILDDSNQCCGHPDSSADVDIAITTAKTIAEVMQWTQLQKADRIF